MVVEIPLNRGLKALVDDEDGHLAEFGWCASLRNGKTWYAHRMIRRAPEKPLHLQLHRVVLGITDPKIEVDHVNGDGLDCRRINLRKATRAQNARNRSKNRTSFGRFKCVSWNKRVKKWLVQISYRDNGVKKSHYVGWFTDEEAGARAYDQAATMLFGEFARLNFPKENCHLLNS